MEGFFRPINFIINEVNIIDVENPKIMISKNPRKPIKTGIS